MEDKDLRQRLLEEMQTVRTVDCHSHTYGPKVYYERGPYDLFTLKALFPGLVHEQRLKKASSDTDRWRFLKAKLARAWNISYWRHHMIVYRNLFDFKDSELNDRNWRSLNERIKERTADPRWYDHVTKDLCQFETQVKVIPSHPRTPWLQDWEPEYFTAVLRMDPPPMNPVLNLCDPASREYLEDYLEEELSDLDVLKQCLREILEKYRKKGAVGIKLAHAYHRTLASEEVPYETAFKVYEKALEGNKVTPEEIKAFQDHIIYFLADLAGELGLVFQIHTGLQRWWGDIPGSNPLLLIPLILSHRSTRFDLFHAGYPFSREMGMLGKHYPNVWVNMCWMYVLTMEGSRQSLSEWIDLVPGDRVLGFGSDVLQPEMVYGHLLMARSCIADVLSEKVKRDFISEEVARDLVHKLLRENAMNLYSL